MTTANDRIGIHALCTSWSPRLDGAEPGHVRLLASAWGELPPIVVHRPTLEVIDGLHRLRAAEARGDESIAVEFFDGTANEAFLLAVRSNLGHGLPLTHADRLAAAVRIIDGYPDWSDRRVAAASGLSARAVAGVRARTTECGEVMGRVGLDGRVRPVDPAAGRVRAAELLARRPEASVREIAAAAGIGLGTAQDVRERLRTGRDLLPARLRNHGHADEERPAAGRGRPTDLEFGQVVAMLRRDPSLRLTEAGRAVLRLLGAHFIGDSEWDRLVGSVPPHCGSGLAQAARHCSEVWARFATEVESRYPAAD